MKRITTILLLLLFVMAIFSCYFVVKYFDENTVEQYNNLVKIANENICNTEIEGTKENGVIGILEIEKLNIKAPIMEGTTQDILKYAVGHFIESDIWNGNVALASHNRGSYAHYFENISKLEEGDKIIYTTNQGSRVYSVVTKRKILETDWNTVLESESKNTITLVTCITGDKEYRLCIRAIEI